jgi:Putative prokaryotic signal transducing protein
VDEGVRLTIVGSDVEAEVVCGLLRDAGVKCGHRPAAPSGGPWEALATGGPREVLVAPEDLERAREILAAEEAAPTDDAE